VRRAEVAGAYRRRVEVIDELVFVIETGEFSGVVARMQRYGGRTPLISSGKDHALFSLSSGLLLRIRLASTDDWGFHMLTCTGSDQHLRKLKSVAGSLREIKSSGVPFPNESVLYAKLGLDYIEPELREGTDEVERAAHGTLPVLITAKKIRGELHAHSTSSDGGNSIEEMAEARGRAGTSTSESPIIRRV
jgi:DNA polymerase (family 10)